MYTFFANFFKSVANNLSSASPQALKSNKSSSLLSRRTRTILDTASLTSQQPRLEVRVDGNWPLTMENTKDIDKEGTQGARFLIKLVQKLRKSFHVFETMRSKAGNWCLLKICNLWKKRRLGFWYIGKVEGWRRREHVPMTPLRLHNPWEKAKKEIQHNPAAISDISHNHHNRRWCTFFKSVDFLI